MLTTLLVVALSSAAPVQDSAPASKLVLETGTSPAGAGSSLPNIARGADGQLYLSWVEREAEGQALLSFATLREGGWSEPVEVLRAGDLFLNWADFPSLCALEGGTLIAHWLRKREAGHSYTAEFALSADRGATWSSPRPLHSVTTGPEFGFVSFAALDRETFGALWLDGRKLAPPADDGGHGEGHGDEHAAGEMALYFRTISAEGELGEERVLDPRVCDCCQTDLVSAGGGRLLAIYRDRSAAEVRDISLVELDGGAWSQPGSVHDDGWSIPGCPVNGPRVLVLGETIAAAWFTGVGDGGGSVLVGFRAPGAKSFGFPIDVDDGLPMGRVDLVALDAESVLVSWLEYAGEASGAEWRVRRVWKDGRQGSALTIAVVPSERSSGFLRMAAQDGGALLAWTGGGDEPRVETARVSLE